MANLFRFQIDASALDDLTDSLNRLSKEQLVELQVKTVNKTATKVDAQAKDFVSGEVNLDRAYVEESITLRPAEAPRAVASVSARMRNVTLSRFDAEQQETPVNWSNERILKMGMRFDKWPGWTKRTGDDMRGIEANMKAKGVGVTVKRGRDKTLGSAFLLPLRNGGGRMGVFVHEGGRLKHLYGPAVYQLYRTYLNTNEDAIVDDMQATFRADLDSFLDKAL